MMPGNGRGPDADDAEATAPTQTATDEGFQSTSDCIAGQPDVDVPEWPPRRNWSGERAVIVDALALTLGPWAAREDVPAFGTTRWADASPVARVLSVLVYLVDVHDRCSRAEWAWTDRARQDEEVRLTALREASHAISASLDWSAQSQRPSHAELERRRAVVVVPR